MNCKCNVMYCNCLCVQKKETMNVVSIRKNSKTARNAINHTQPLPP